MVKRKFKGNEGWITSYAFWFLGRKWLIAISETKWHRGGDYKRAPIWFSIIGENIPSVFMGKLAIGFERKKKS
jgi:hypothetical protein